MILQINLQAQINFKASAEKVVEQGEMFRLSFTVNAQASGFRAPKISDFTVLAGPSSSTSQSYSFINGKQTQSFETGYNYTLRADKVGTFTIPPAQVTVNGKTYTSNSLKIEVLKSGTASASGNNTGASGSHNSGEIFVRINLSKTEVYQGEPIVASVKIYVKDMQLSDLTPASPAYNGFWHDELPTASRITLNREKYNDQIYSVGLLRKDLLIAQSSGKLIIPPMEMEVLVREKVGQRRDFFGRLVNVYDDAKRKIKTPARTIIVKQLPAGKPAGFSGLVGTNFKIEASFSENNIKTDEGTNFKLKISGNGNIKLFNMPDLSFPSGLDAYPPETKERISSNAGGTSGYKIFDYFILAREPGEYNIPPVKISYFDLNSLSYKTLQTDAYRIHVSKGENYSGGNHTTVSPNDAQSSVVNLDNDIRYIHADTRLHKKGELFACSNSFYALYLVVFLLFLIPVFIRRKRIKENANIAQTKNKYAAKISRKRLKKAAGFLKSNENEAFYKEVLTAVWGYLSDKLNISTAELNKERVKSELSDNELAERIVSLLDTCEYAQYAQVESQPAEIYEQAKKIIQDMEK